MPPLASMASGISMLMAATLLSLPLSSQALPVLDALTGHFKSELIL